MLSTFKTNKQTNGVGGIYAYSAFGVSLFSSLAFVVVFFG